MKIKFFYFILAGIGTLFFSNPLFSEIKYPDCRRYYHCHDKFNERHCVFYHRPCKEYQVHTFFNSPHSTNIHAHTFPKGKTNPRHVFSKTLPSSIPKFDLTNLTPIVHLNDTVHILLSNPTSRPGRVYWQINNDPHWICNGMEFTAIANTVGDVTLTAMIRWNDGSFSLPQSTSISILPLENLPDPNSVITGFPSKNIFIEKSSSSKNPSQPQRQPFTPIVQNLITSCNQLGINATSVIVDSRKGVISWDDESHWGEFYGDSLLKSYRIEPLIREDHKALKANPQLIQGLYQTNWGQMQLYINGDLITGTFDYHGENYLIGKIRDNIFAGIWVKPPKNKSSMQSGPFQFVFTENWKSFKGLWGRKGQGEIPLSKLWNGNKVRDRFRNSKELSPPGGPGSLIENNSPQGSLKLFAKNR